MKLSFSTLGCPTWDLDTICARGKEYGFDGVDFRGYLDDLDVTILPMFSTHADATRRQLADAGLAVSGISSSISACVPEKLAQNLDEAKRTIPVAKGLDAEFVRVYGYGDLHSCSRSELAKIGRDTIEQKFWPSTARKT